MHRTIDAARHRTAYRERLSPSLWVLVSAAVCGPMAAFVFAPVDTVLGLVMGVVVGIGVVAALVAASPVVEVSETHLRVGRARIEREHLGSVEALEGEQARLARGPGLGPSSWHMLRGGIDGVVRVEITDADDPVAHWVFSSRTPGRIAAILRGATD